MTAKVKAAVLLKPKTLELREFPRPAIGPDDALLRIEACGICGSDYEQYDGAQPPHEDYTSFPVVAGHEQLGRIEEGKSLIAGIRPEDFEDASLAESKGEATRASTFQAPVDVVEWLGNETYAYIPFEAPPEVEKQLHQLEQDLDGESMRTQLVISLDGASTIKEGENAEIWLDAAKLHLFDPSTGDNLTVDREHAGEIPEASARV